MASAVSNGLCFKDELYAAVNAHNAAAHSVTGLPPEEVMYGRKIKRRLPLLRHEKANYDEELLNRRDKHEKLKAKEREDSRRGARKCRVGPGDTVIIERLTRIKGDSRFDPHKYTVIKVDNGNLVLQNDHGQTLKRHVTQTKKIGRWREYVDKSKGVGLANQSFKDLPPERTSERPHRTKTLPSYLSDYVRMLED